MRMSTTTCQILSFKSPRHGDAMCFVQCLIHPIETICLEFLAKLTPNIETVHGVTVEYPATCFSNQ